MIKLTQKLLEIKSKVPYLKKDARGNNSSYVSGSTILAKLNPLFEKRGITIKMDLRNSTIQTVTRKKGKDQKEVTEFYIALEVVYTFTDENESISFNWSGFGCDQDPSFAHGKALTYAERYFFTKQFQIPSDDMDPEVWGVKAGDKKKARSDLNKALKNCKDEECIREQSKKWSRKWGDLWEMETDHRDGEYFKDIANVHIDRVNGISPIYNTPYTYEGEREDD
jgi:hypothetical protein